MQSPRIPPAMLCASLLLSCPARLQERHERLALIEATTPAVSFASPWKAEGGALLDRVRAPGDRILLLSGPLPRHATPCSAPSP